MNELMNKKELDEKFLCFLNSLGEKEKNELQLTISNIGKVDERGKYICIASLIDEYDYAFRFFLNGANNFTEFYRLFNELWRGIDTKKRDILYDVLDDYCDLYPEIFYLKQNLQYELLFFKIKGASKETTEKDYQKRIIQQFKNIPQFKNYTFIKDEFKCNDGRIDIFAKDNVTGKNVIMELKIGKKSPNRQLISYNYCLGNDNILIGITEKQITNKIENIIYYTYEELGINLD